MTQQDVFLNGIILTFILITVIFAIRYYKLLSIITKEYKEAKNVVSTIIFTFKRNQDKQNQTIDRLANDVETAQSGVDRLNNNLLGIEERIKNLLIQTQTTPELYKKIIEEASLIKKEVSRVAQNQDNLQKQLNELDEKLRNIGKNENVPTTIDENQPLTKSTETEKVVIQFLIEGPKTAPEVEQKIGKTREHTARLMKKLWQEGYIERDTNKIPYVYRVTEKLKNLEVKTN